MTHPPNAFSGLVMILIVLAIYIAYRSKLGGYHPFGRLLFSLGWTVLIFGMVMTERWYDSYFVPIFGIIVWSFGFVMIFMVEDDVFETRKVKKNRRRRK